MARQQPEEGDEYEAYVPVSELRSWINGDRTGTLVWDEETMVDRRPRDLEPGDVARVSLRVESVGLEE